MRTALSTAEDSRDGVRLLTGFTIAHGIFHFMQQSFAVMLPAIKETFGISPIQIGALMTAKEIAMGVSSLPGGVVSDRLKRYRGIIMAACMALFGLSDRDRSQPADGSPVRPAWEKTGAGTRTFKLRHTDHPTGSFRKRDHVYGYHRHARDIFAQRLCPSVGGHP